ncbi:hypothetical protein MTO96_047744 [Rhipicephalus appendiculatus]
MHGLRSAVAQLWLLLLTRVLLLPMGKQTNLTVYAVNPCELKGCPASKPGYINVHILSHSHIDAGWLQTLDVIYETYATTIYDTTISALLQKSSRRFVSAENVFFARWWRQTPAKVKDSVRNSQYEDVILQDAYSSWVADGRKMTKAVTHYTATIDQMTLGLRFLNSTFGPQCGVPSVAWQADPFGHSVAQAAMFSRVYAVNDVSK